jgi:hypothetical protein
MYQYIFQAAQQDHDYLPFMYTEYWVDQELKVNKSYINYSNILHIQCIIQLLTFVEVNIYPLHT